MGLLVDGVWHDEWYNTEDNDGKFIREDAQFRDWISNFNRKLGAIICMSA